MRIAGCGLDTLMAEQPADDRQRQTSADGKARETVTKIVDAHVVEAGKCPDASPWLFAG